jgi:hypothetical protein
MWLILIVNKELTMKQVNKEQEQMTQGGGDLDNKNDTKK